ncbi:MAG: Hsp70 family protein [Bacillus sp. (in: Bacteria)]|nr:Hsp70 family protein [Bacillus sp. (in: firmicutes)]MCM1428144.1 Hsp70 family protein [Eubacterium sp.]
MAVIGIDLGTTNSLASIWRDGKVELIPNTFGEYLTPSVVSFGDDGEIYVGKVAKERLITAPSVTFAEFKRNMGTGSQYFANGRNYTAEDLSSFVLRRLREDAEAYLGEEVTEAVISVPAYFNDDKRCATKNAGKLAGLNVERLINEPSAVALKHHMGVEEVETFIIFDFGGGTLDVSLVDAFENMVEIQAVSGDNYLGGKDFNEIIAEDFYKENHITRDTLTEEEQGIVLKEAEALKWQLTKADEAQRTVYIQKQEYIMRMTNQHLIHIGAELFKRMSLPIKRVINDSGMGMDEVDKLILVGGSSKMPVVQQYLKTLLDIPVVLDESPDESIAAGVGIAAAIKERAGDVKDMVLTDICPFSLGTSVYDGSFSPIIERNDTLPCSRTREYVTVRDYQTAMLFPIYQGDNIVASDNLLLGTMEITDLPEKLRGEVAARVTFLYDINGILDIQIVSGEQAVHKVIMNKKMGLSEAELEERLEKLREMTLSSLEDENIRYLQEKAQRLYRECSPAVREYVAAQLARFRNVLLYERNSRARREACVQLSVCLEAVERNKFDFHGFDESFFDDDREDE